MPKVAPSSAHVSTKRSCVDPLGQDPDTDASDMCGLYVDDNPPCRNMPFCGRAKARLTGALSKGGKVHGVATNVYLWKTSEKPKETGQNENSKFGSCICVCGRY